MTDKKIKKCFFIFLLGLILAIGSGYPTLFLTDEWISANQLNHLTTGNDLLYGYYPYGDSGYAESHNNILCYTLALPVLSFPIYKLFSLFGNNFRLSVIIVTFCLLWLVLLCIELWYPRYARYRGIPWTYGVFFSSLIFMVLDMWLYRAYTFSTYGETAALVFTNHIIFALFCVISYLIFNEVFNSEWWALFGLVAVICSSSYLFWSGNAKDHLLTVLFLAIAAYFFILFLKQNTLFHLISSYIALGWTAWVRPELGLTLAASFILVSLILIYHKGLLVIFRSLICTLAIPVGALPLFINNFGLTGNPLTPPWKVGTSFVAVAQTYYIPSQGYYTQSPFTITDMFLDVGRFFFDPVNEGTAGIFQVSPLSFFALVFMSILLFQYIIRKKRVISHGEVSIVVFVVFWALGIFLAYYSSFSSLPYSRGMIPDIRYLAPIYLPLLILGIYSFKMIEFDEICLKSTLKIFLPLVLVELPLLFVIYQYFWGKSLGSQVLFNMGITYLFLAISVCIYFLVNRKKIDKKWFMYSLPPLMLSSLTWLVIIKFRFAGGFDGYHFWLPVIQYIWLIQRSIFPFY